MWLKAERTVARIAELGQREGVIFCRENLNTAADHPGFGTVGLEAWASR
jgi:hydroxypyruvate isomerase